MPQPLAPPPANDIGARTFPRMLQRWLDVNPVTKLDRIGSYLTLPAFSIAINWQGYSDIVAAFNFEGPNNFSLKALDTVPSNPNYMLCVMWRDSSGNVHRYAIWKNVGEVTFFNIPLYEGQLIKKNFRFEIWSTDSSTSVQTSSIAFTTSVLGFIDYRYGNNFTLVNSDAISTNFNCSASIPSGTNIIPVGAVWPTNNIIINNLLSYLITGLPIDEVLTLQILGGETLSFPIQNGYAPFANLAVDGSGNFTTISDRIFISANYPPTVIGSTIQSKILTTYPAFPLPLTFPTGSYPSTN